MNTQPLADAVAACVRSAAEQQARERIIAALSTITTRDLCEAWTGEHCHGCRSNKPPRVALCPACLAELPAELRDRLDFELEPRDRTNPLYNIDGAAALAAALDYLTATHKPQES